MLYTGMRRTHLVQAVAATVGGTICLLGVAIQGTQYLVVTAAVAAAALATWIAAGLVVRWTRAHSELQRRRHQRLVARNREAWVRLLQELHQACLNAAAKRLDDEALRLMRLSSDRVLCFQIPPAVSVPLAAELRRTRGELLQVSRRMNGGGQDLAECLVAVSSLGVHCERLLAQHTEDLAVGLTPPRPAPWRPPRPTR